jgi:MoaA/NifB/PqqE/SkfB family radical SAM enzyme
MIDRVKRVVARFLSPEAPPAPVKLVLPLYEIILDICGSCNAKCLFCSRLGMPPERSKGVMSFDLFSYALKEAKKYGIARLRLYATGEPTVNRNLGKMIDLAKEMGFYIDLSTNGFLAHKYFEALLKVDYLQFSLDGWDEASYGKYRFPLKFAKVYDNIEKISRMKQGPNPVICAHVCTTKFNSPHYLDKIIKTWGNIVDMIVIDYMLPYCSFEDGKFVHKKNDAIADEYCEIERQEIQRYECPYPFHILTVAWDGKIALCCWDFAAQLDLGNIQDGIETIYNNPHLQRVRGQFLTQNMNLCKECLNYYTLDKDSTIKIDRELRRLEGIEKIKAQVTFKGNWYFNHPELS